MAEEPDRESVTETFGSRVAELREQLGEAFRATPLGSGEFGDAVQRVAAEGEVDDTPVTPPGNDYAGRQPDAWPQSRPDAHAWAGDGFVQPPRLERGPQPGWGQPYGGMGFTPQTSGFNRGEQPIALMRRTAFDLERLAHGLETAELFDEADAVREAADRLRTSARERSRGSSGPASRGGRRVD